MTYNAVIDACSAGNWEACHQVTQLGGLGVPEVHSQSSLIFSGEMKQDGFFLNNIDCETHCEKQREICRNERLSYRNIQHGSPPSK